MSCFMKFKVNSFDMYIKKFDPPIITLLYLYSQNFSNGKNGVLKMKRILTAWILNHLVDHSCVIPNRSKYSKRHLIAVREIFKSVKPI